MAEVLAVLQNIQQVYEIICWAVDIYKGVKGAPQAVVELTGEVECLVTCLNAFNYVDCRQALMQASDIQQKDFSTILEGCKMNVIEIKTFVSECQIIMKATDAAYKKRQKKKGLPVQILDKVKNIWKRYNFSQTDKQPMRDKLAIPLHSLNVFLVSLTFSRMSLNNTAPSATPVAPKNWAVVGRMVSFKNAKFASTDLIIPGVEERIMEAAHHIVFGRRCIGDCCPCCTCEADSCHCDDDIISTVPTGSMKSPGPGRKYSGGKKRLVSDNMYLVRPTSGTRGRSKSVVRRVKREVFTNDDDGDIMERRRIADDIDDIDGSLASDLIDSDDSPPPTPLIQDHLTLPTDGLPRSSRIPSPHRGAGRPRPENSEPRGRYNSQSSPIADSGHDAYRRGRHGRQPHISEADIERAKQEARETAMSEIRGVQRQAREELELGMDVTEREAHRRSEAEHRTLREPVDVRRYMEMRYGIMIDRASSEERRVAEEAEGLQEVNEELRKLSERRTRERRSRMESEYHTRHDSERVRQESVFEEFDLHISEASEDESEPIAAQEAEMMYLQERQKLYARPERARNRNRFVIPETEYEPVTTRLGEGRSNRTRRHEDYESRTDTYEDLERRTRELREREATLRTREREGEERLRRLNESGRTREREVEREQPRDHEFLYREHGSVPETPHLETLRTHRPTTRVRRRHTEETPYNGHIEIRHRPDQDQQHEQIVEEEPAATQPPNRFRGHEQVINLETYTTQRDRRRGQGQGRGRERELSPRRHSSTGEQSSDSEAVVQQSRNHSNRHEQVIEIIPQLRTLEQEIGPSTTDSEVEVESRVHDRTRRTEEQQRQQRRQQRTDVQQEDDQETRARIRDRMRRRRRNNGDDSD